MALRLLVADSAAERDAARHVEARVFLEAFGLTPDLMEREYGPYDDHSRFVTVIDGSDGSAVGSARLIIPDSTGHLKTLTDVAGDPWHLSVADSLRAAGLSGRPVWDVGSLAVAPPHRGGAAGHEVFLALVHGLYRYSRNCGVEGLVTVLDDRVLHLLQDMGVPWAPMAGAASKFFLGSACTPCVCLVGSAGEHVWAHRPDLAPALVDGMFRSIALDPADLFPGRGAPLSTGVTGSRPGQWPVEPGKPSGWRPPAYRRNGVFSETRGQAEAAVAQAGS
jgi:hypothetical protein